MSSPNSRPWFSAERLCQATQPYRPSRDRTGETAPFGRDARCGEAFSKYVQGLDLRSSPCRNLIHLQVSNPIACFK